MPTLGSSAEASWLADHLEKGSAPARSPPGSSDSPKGTDPSWVLDFVPILPPGDARFVRAVAWPRFSLIFSITMAASAAFILPNIWLQMSSLLVLTLMNLAIIAARYSGEPALESLRGARSHAQAAVASARAIRIEISELTLETQTLEIRHERETRQIKRRIFDTEKEAEKEIEIIGNKLQLECAPSEHQRQLVDADEQLQLANLAQTKGQKATNLRQQLQRLPQEEASELAAALSDFQSAHYQNGMSSARVAHAAISGLGPQLKGTLIANGIASARDVNQNRLMSIPGFGPTRVNAVIAWAHRVEQRVRSAMPQQLPATTSNLIRQKFASRRQLIEQELNRVEIELKNEETEIRARSSKIRRGIDAFQAGPKAAAEGEIQAIRINRAKALSLLGGEENRIRSAAEAELASLRAKLSELNHALVQAEWDHARADARVKAYSRMTFSRYLGYIAFSSQPRG